MKTFKTLKKTYMISQNEDGSLFITEDGKTSIEHVGALIASYGGVQRILEFVTRK